MVHRAKSATGIEKNGYFGLLENDFKSWRDAWHHTHFPSFKPLCDAWCEDPVIIVQYYCHLMMVSLVQSCHPHFLDFTWAQASACVWVIPNLWMLKWNLVSSRNLCFNCTKSYSRQPGPLTHLWLPMYPPHSHSQNHSPQLAFYIYGWNDFLPDPHRSCHHCYWHQCLPHLPH